MDKAFENQGCDYCVQEGTDEISGNVNPKLINTSGADAERMMSLMLNAGKDTLPGVPSLPTIEQALRAVELLTQLDDARIPLAISIFHQCGLNVRVGEIPATDAHEYDTKDPFDAPIHELLTYALARAKWTFYPQSLLYRFYLGWAKNHHFTTPPCPKHRFMSLLRVQIRDFEGAGWRYTEDKQGKPNAMRPGQRMTEVEPLLKELGCEDWCRQKPALTYTGIYKIT